MWIYVTCEGVFEMSFLPEYIMREKALDRSKSEQGVTFNLFLLNRAPSQVTFTAL